MEAELVAGGVAADLQHLARRDRERRAGGWRRWASRYGTSMLSESLPPGEIHDDEIAGAAPCASATSQRNRGAPQTRR